MYGVVLKGSEIARHSPVLWQRDDETEYDFLYRFEREEGHDHWDAMFLALQ
jgi:hypothetical protein